MVYTDGLNNPEEFLEKESQMHFNACLTLLVQIAEQSQRIGPDLKERATSIPWHLIKGFRNIAVHEYVYVDAQKVFEICTIHIPALQNNIEDFIKQTVAENYLSEFELTLSTGSPFYLHVRFENLLMK